MRKAVTAGMLADLCEISGALALEGGEIDSLEVDLTYCAPSDGSPRPSEA